MTQIVRSAATFDHPPADVMQDLIRNPPPAAIVQLQTKSLQREEVDYRG